MDEAQVSKKHHYIPIFYTKRWAGTDGRICEFSKPYQNTVKPKRVHPAGTGYVDRLYELRGLRHELQDQFERCFLKPADAGAANALAILESKGEPHAWKSAERSAWTRFLLTLLMRAPEDVEDLKAFVAADWARTDPDYEVRYAAAKRKDDPSSMMEWLAINAPNLVENSSFRIGQRLMDNSKIGEMINNFNWFAVNTMGARYELLTSDRPIFMSRNLASEDSYLMLPIGPRLIFFATREGKLEDQIRKRSINELTQVMNTVVVEGAARFVYGTNDQQMRFVQNRMGLRPAERPLAKLRQLREER